MQGIKIQVKYMKVVSVARESIMNADHQNSSQAELQELRTKDAVNTKIIKLLIH